MPLPSEPGRSSGALDPLRAFLVARNCPKHVVDEGFHGLIVRWMTVAEQVEHGYAFSLDEYLNDMDLRDLVHAAAHAGGDVADEDVLLLQLADERFLGETEPCPCVWGPEIESEEDLQNAEEWWYFRRPRELSDNLRDEMARWGLI
jgi:hypothetical protein